MKNFEVWPAPMEGVFTPQFISTVSQLKLIKCWMTPFLKVNLVTPRAAKIKSFIRPYSASSIPFTLQLMGSDPIMLAETANIAIEEGVDSINLNCACPSERVVKHHSGGACLYTSESFIEYCNSFAKKFSGNFSVKIRAGFDNPADMNLFIPELIKIPNLQKIFFHYRTVNEKYMVISPNERMRRFQLISSLCIGKSLILNGDINSVAEAQLLHKQFHCQGVMIGRAWLHDPWLLQRFEKTGTALEPVAGCQKLYQALLDTELSRGKHLEYARMIWGANSAYFKKICNTTIKLNQSQNHNEKFRK